MFSCIGGLLSCLPRLPFENVTLPKKWGIDVVSLNVLRKDARGRFSVFFFLFFSHGALKTVLLISHRLSMDERDPGCYRASKCLCERARERAQGGGAQKKKTKEKACFVMDMSRVAPRTWTDSLPERRDKPR